MRFSPAYVAAASLLAFSSLSWASAGSAQSDDQKALDRKVEEFAACFAGSPKHRSLRKKLLSIPANSPRAIANAQDIMTSDCMQEAGNPRATMGDLAGAVYTSLYRKLGRDTGPKVVSATNFDNEYDKDALPLLQVSVDLRTYGNCLASFSPDAAHRFVVAPIWSDTEAGEVSTIASAIQACGEVPEFATTQMALKGLIAESLYKSALAQDYR